MPGARNSFVFQLRFLASVFICSIGLLQDGVRAQGGPDPERVIQKMDSDGDGRISQDEWLRPPQAFKRIDRDKDSFVTVEELREFTKKRFSGPEKLEDELWRKRRRKPRAQ